MRTRPTLTLAMLFALGATHSSAVAQQSPSAAQTVEWTTFRGSSSTGATPAPALSGSATYLEIEWSNSLPGEGYSTPVATNDALFVTTAIQSAGTRQLFEVGFLLALLATGGLLVGAVRTLGNSPRGSGPVFAYTLVLGTLVTLTVVGFDLLGCGRDPIRRWIYAGAMLYLCQLAGSGLCQDTRRARRGLGGLGVGWSAWLLWQFPFWEVYGENGIPLAMVLVVALAPATTMLPAFFGKLGHAAPLVYVALGCGYLLHLSVTLEVSPYLQRQPVQELVLPAWYWASLLILLPACLALLTRAGAGGLRSRSGPAIAGLATLATLPGLTAPLINSSRFLQYQLVRGEFDPALGWAVTGPTLALAVAIAWLASTRRPELQTNGTLPLRLGIALVLLCGSGISLASIAPQTGLVHSYGAIICLDIDSGAIRWQHSGIELRAETGSAFNSPATPSPTVLGDTVFAYFGPAGIFACDRRTGRQLWSRTLTADSSMYGAASSLTVSRAANILIVQADSSRASWALGLDPQTGQIRWKTIRAVGESWRSPIVVSFQDRDVVCMWGRSEIDILDAATGQRLHRLGQVDVGAGDPVASPIVADGMLLLAGPEALVGIDFEQLMQAQACELSLALPGDQAAPGGGEAINPEFRIDLADDGPVCATPAYRDGTAVLVSEGGVILVVDTQAPGVRWRIDSAETRSSPLIVGHRGYLADLEGTLRVIATDSPVRRICASIDLGEPVHASPVVCDGRLLLRTQTKIVCLRGAQVPPPTGPAHHPTTDKR